MLKKLQEKLNELKDEVLNMDKSCLKFKIIFKILKFSRIISYH